MPDEEREEELRPEERLTLERADELFRLRDEFIFDEEILLRREDTDLEGEERYLEVEYELLEVLRLTDGIPLEVLNLLGLLE